MTLEQFEQLVSAWLDEPERADLRAALDDAVRDCPSFADVLRRWQRSEALLHQGLPQPEAVDWNQLHARISARLNASAPPGDDEAVDGLLRALPTVEQRVDWPLLRSRISSAVAQSARSSARRRRWLAGSAGLFAAAAALVLALWPHTPPVAPPVGVFRMTVSAAAPPSAAPEGGVFSMRVAALATVADPPQRFFAMDPLVPAGPSAETVNFY